MRGMVCSGFGGADFFDRDPDHPVVGEWEDVADECYERQDGLDVPGLVQETLCSEEIAKAYVADAHPD